VLIVGSYGSALFESTISNCLVIDFADLRRAVSALVVGGAFTVCAALQAGIQ
jgi:hypothetical protein